MFLGGNLTLNDVVILVSTTIPVPQQCPFRELKFEVCEEHDAGTNFEPEHVRWKASRIEVINEFNQIYVLLNHTVAALVNVLITRKIIYYVVVHHLRSIIGGCDDGSACQPLMVLVVGIEVMENVVEEINQP